MKISILFYLLIQMPFCFSAKFDNFKNSVFPLFLAERDNPFNEFSAGMGFLVKDARTIITALPNIKKLAEAPNNFILFVKKGNTRLYSKRLNVDVGAGLAQFEFKVDLGTPLEFVDDESRISETLVILGLETDGELKKIFLNNNSEVSDSVYCFKKLFGPNRKNFVGAPIIDNKQRLAGIAIAIDQDNLHIHLTPCIGTIKKFVQRKALDFFKVGPAIVLQMNAIQDQIFTRLKNNSLNTVIFNWSFDRPVLDKERCRSVLGPRKYAFISFSLNCASTYQTLDGPQMTPLFASTFVGIRKIKNSLQDSDLNSGDLTALNFDHFEPNETAELNFSRMGNGRVSCRLKMLYNEKREKFWVHFCITPNHSFSAFSDADIKIASQVAKTEREQDLLVFRLRFHAFKLERILDILALHLKAL